MKTVTQQVFRARANSGFAKRGMLYAGSAIRMKKKCSVFGLGVSILLATIGGADAAIVCVGPAATGNGSGVDWNNLAAWSSSPARGDTWYLVNGAYAAKTFTTPASGTTLITIKKATVADHGGITAGWADTLGNGQATFGAFQINSSYWVFDGQTGDGFSVAPPDLTPSHYGFAFSENATPITIGQAQSSAYTTITFKHFYAKATSSDVPKGFLQGGYTISHVDNVTVSYCLLDGWQVGFWARGPAVYGGQPYVGSVWEYTIYLNAYSSSANHGTCFDADSTSITGLTVRYSYFYGHSGNAGLTAIVEANNSDLSNTRVYGCVFDGTLTGRAVIGGTSAGRLSTTLVYNNVFANLGSSSGGIIDGVGGTGNILYNNLVYNSPATIGTGVTHDHNTFYSCTSVPSEADGQVGSGDPFSNSAGFDYRVKANTAAGIALGSPYDIDPLGTLRTSWTRGAYEFQSRLGTNPVISVSPSFLSFGAVATNTTVTNTLLVQNVGQGTLAGVATLLATTNGFQIVNGSYSLPAGQSKVIQVTYRPTGNVSDSQTINFTGGGGASVPVSGSLLAQSTPPGGLTMQASSATLSGAFALANGAISQSISTDVTTGGQAVFNFNLTNAGTYVIQALVNAPSIGENSFYLNIDGQPQDPVMTWDIPITTGFEQRLVSWRGAGTSEADQFAPKSFDLTTGAHQLIIIGREPNVQLQTLSLIKLPPPPQNLRLAFTQ